MLIAPTSSYTYSMPHSERTSISLSEFHTLIAIDASMCCIVELTKWSWRRKDTYQDHIASMKANVANLTDKVSAQRVTLDTTCKLSQEAVEAAEGIRMGLREVNNTVNDFKGDVSAMINDIKGDVSAMRLEFSVLKTLLLERISS